MSFRRKVLLSSKNKSKVTHAFKKNFSLLLTRKKNVTISVRIIDVTQKKNSVCHRCLCIISNKTESVDDIFYLTVLYWVSKQFVRDFEKNW